MKKLTPKEIHEKFNAVSNEDSKFTKHLDALSEALADLRNAGIDVQMHMLGVSTEMGFELNTGYSLKSRWQRSSAILRIGGSEHLVAYVTKMQWHDENTEKDVTRNANILLVSEFDIRFQGKKNAIRTKRYDLDENGLIELQEFIIARAGEQKIIANADKHGVLQDRRNDSSVFTTVLPLPPTRRLPTK